LYILRNTPLFPKSPFKLKPKDPDSVEIYSPETWSRSLRSLGTRLGCHLHLSDYLLSFHPFAPNEALSNGNALEKG
jgi:hypothetical protein